MPTLRNILRNQTAKMRSHILSKFYTNKHRSKSKSIPRLSISELRGRTIANKIAKSPKQSALVRQIQKSYKKKVENKISRATRRLTNAVRNYRTRSLTNPNPDDCPICHDPMFNPALATTLYYCKHTFHSACIKHWAANKFQPHCPICRARILYYENPTIVSPTLEQEEFMRSLEEARNLAQLELDEIAKADAIIRDATIALKNRIELDGSNTKMTRKTMEKLRKEIIEAQSIKNIYNNYNNNRELARKMENELIANRIREREEVNREEANRELTLRLRLRNRERRERIERENATRLQALLPDDYSDQDGGARCANCLVHQSIL